MAKKKAAAKRAGSSKKSATKGATAKKSSTRKSSGKKSSAKKSAKKGTSRKKSGGRELIDTGRDKRFVRRDEQGQFSESDDVGRSLSQDRRRTAKRKVKSGQGDRGDR